jgi:hypothetical protein
MKKILFGLLMMSAAYTTQAQIAVTTDTLYDYPNRGNSNYSPKIVVTNNSNADFDLVWNTEPTMSILPTDYTIFGVCTTPGACYAYNAASHTVTIPVGGSVEVHPSMAIGNNARLDSNAYIVVSTNIPGKSKLVWNIKALGAVGIKTVKSKLNLDIYPQPTTGIVNIVHNSNKVTTASLYNMLGKKVEDYITPVGATGFSFNMADRPDGIYVISLYDAFGAVLATQRITKN